MISIWSNKKYEGGYIDMFYNMIEPCSLFFSLKMKATYADNHAIMNLHLVSDASTNKELLRFLFIFLFSKSCA